MKLPLWVPRGSHFLGFGAPFPTQAIALPAALCSILLPGSGDGVRGRWEVGGGRRGEVGGGKRRRREVGRRENFWGREEMGKKKKPWAGRMGFWFIPKRLQRPHPQLMHWWLLVHSSPLLSLPPSGKCDKFPTVGLYHHSLRAVSATNFLLLDFIITPSQR